MVLLSRSFRLVKFYAGSLGCASDCLLAWQNEEATSGGPALANAAIPPAQAEAAANEAPAADVRESANPYITRMGFMAE